MDVLAFADRCRDDLNGCPSPLLKRTVVEKARELARAGRLWRMCFDTITLDGSGTYVLADLPQCARLHDIDVVTLGGRPIYPVSRGASMLTAQESPTAGPPQWTRSASSIEIRPDPGGGALVVQGVLIPEPDSTTLPDDFYDEWVEGIEHGVKAHLMASPGKTWSAPQLAGYHQDQWLIWLAKARSYGRAGSATARRRSIDPWARSTSSVFTA